MKPQEWVQLLVEPIDLNKAIEFVFDPNAGGIAVFLGTTRAETTHEGAALTALDYEAYEEMAKGQLKDLAQRARQKWPIVRLAILHRLGRVELGAPSVIVAVSTPHRPEAFEACRWIIDTLKAEVAIWKKEIWGDGSASWVHPQKRGTEGQRDKGTK